MIENSSLSYVSYYRKIGNRLNSARARHLEVLKNSHHKKEPIVVYSDEQEKMLKVKYEARMKDKLELRLKKKAEKLAKKQLNLEKKIREKITYHLFFYQSDQILLKDDCAYITKDFCLNLDKKISLNFGSLLMDLGVKHNCDNPIVLYEKYNYNTKCYLYNDTKFVTEITPFEFPDLSN